MKIDLKNVTLCVVDCISQRLALRAMRKCQEYFNFERAILFSDKFQNETEDLEFCKISKISNINDYSFFMLKKIGSHIRTEFALVIQWDGYIVNHRAWDDNFKKYDYIGAKWDHFKDKNNIGNGGFSFRSKNLLDATSDQKFEFVQNIPEDVQICRTHRELLENNFNIKFAPVSVADKFSYEGSHPDHPTFGFHALHNMWRHCSDEELFLIIDELDKINYRNQSYVILLINLYNLKKFNLLIKSYEKIRNLMTEERLIEWISISINNRNFAIKLNNICKSLNAQ
jgi:hypothetical protein